jgi:phage terminase large subunit-like protein
VNTFHYVEGYPLIRPIPKGCSLDIEEAEHADAFLRAMPLVKGLDAGQPWPVMEFQRALFVTLLAVKDENGLRLYRRVLTALPRKQSKSHLWAALALYLLTVEQAPGAEIICAACDREQAAILFDIAASIVRRVPELRAVCQIVDHTKRIIHEASGGVLRAISSDAPSAYGINATAVLFDEFFTQRDREFWDALVTSTAARAQPIVAAITTAGYDKHTPAWELWTMR